MNTLVDITKEDRILISKKVAEIRRYYLDGVQYLLGAADSEALKASDQQLEKVQRPQTPKGGTSVSTLMVHEPSKSPPGLEEIHVGDVTIWLRADLEDIETAKGLLNVFAKRVKARKIKPSLDSHHSKS